MTIEDTYTLVFIFATYFELRSQLEMVNGHCKSCIIRGSRELMLYRFRGRMSSLVMHTYRVKIRVTKPYSCVQVSVHRIVCNSATAAARQPLMAMHARARKAGQAKVHLVCNGGRRLHWRELCLSRMLHHPARMHCQRTSAWSGQGIWEAPW